MAVTRIDFGTCSGSKDKLCSISTMVGAGRHREDYYAVGGGFRQPPQNKSNKPIGNLRSMARRSPADHALVTRVNP